MGVPRVFGWIQKKFKSNKKIVISSPERDIDNLYIDANCLFHPMCFIVLGFYPKWEDKKKLEDVMMKRIMSYLDYIMDHVSPKKKIYISVDGVAPQAKSVQQRYRRYRSIDDILLRESILRKHGVEPPKRWLNTPITPGSEFMERLHNKMIKYCIALKKRKNIPVIYSSCHTEGEGEHKILDDIRNSNDTNEETNCIYGLDADLIFLSLASQKNNIYLLREATIFGKPKTSIDYKNDDPVKDVEQELLYVSIDLMRKSIHNHVIMNIKNNKNKFNEYQIANDFIYFCYLMGNDFIPHIPSLDISTGGLDLTVKAYIECINKYECTLFDYNKMTVNFIFLRDMFKFFEKREHYYFTNILPKHKEKMKKRSCPFNEPHKKELWNIDNMNINFDDPVMLGVGNNEEYKIRYYEHYFKISSDHQELIDKICYEYLKATKWIMLYYFKQCPSFSWKYPYLIAPFASDLYKYMEKNKINFNDFVFDNDIHLTPCQQLLSVIPPSCSFLLPESYKFLLTSNNSPIIDMFPTYVELDYINKLVNFKCNPKIPLVEPERVINATKKLKLSKDEKERNKILKNFTF